MMKVYQPLCPDITFRLAADLDLSPDALEEESTDSSFTSAPETEKKLHLFQENSYNNNNNNTDRWNNRDNCSSHLSLEATRDREISNQGHLSHSAFTHTPEQLTTPLLTSPTTICPPQAAADFSSSDSGTATLQEFLQDKSAFDLTIHDQQPKTNGNSDVGKKIFDNRSDRSDELAEDSDESIEDVSLSQNIPISRPPSRTTVIDPQAAAEENGWVSGSSSGQQASSTSSGMVGIKPQTLHLDIHKPLYKYQGPYTLACDITPSPMQEDICPSPPLSTATNACTNNSITATAATTFTTASATTTTTTTTPTSNSNLKLPRRPRKLPEIPRKHQGLATASSTRERSIFDEIQEALIKEVTETNDEVFTEPQVNVEATPATQYPFILKHAGHLFDKKRLLIGYATCPTRSRDISTSSSSSEAGAASMLDEDRKHIQATTSTRLSSASMASERRRKNSDEDGSKRYSSNMATPYQDLEVTHRGLHRFIPRHADEIQIGIGDPIHVIKEYDDLWCEGVNLRNGERGIFPAMYANDLKFLEDSGQSDNNLEGCSGDGPDGEQDEYWKFTMRYLGSVEVHTHNGDFALCQAINKVAQQGRIKTASLCTLEINQYGIRMIDKSKEGHVSAKFSNFFALKNISFCGTHPSNHRYFAFITKHPMANRFACHVFHSDRSTHRARDALGNAFKRFYQEYMAFTHPTEDIWIE